MVSSKKTIEMEVKLISYKNQPESALILITDITKVKEFEKRKQTDRFKTIYFASVAHDLRTPINAIMCINITLLSVLNETFRNYVTISNNSCKFLLSMVDDILDLSKLELD